MSKKLTKTAYFPRNTSLHEALAAKVITRVVSDGISLRNAVREAIRIAELNKKDIFLLLSVLQDFGMVTNGDYKNYWSNGWGEGIGSEGVDANQGTNYFASNNQKVVTADQNEMFQLFDQIEKMRAFASDEEIVEVNPELEPIIATMQRTQRIVEAMEDDEPVYVSKDPGGEEYIDELDRLHRSFGLDDDEEPKIKGLGVEEASSNNLFVWAAGYSEQELGLIQKAINMAKADANKGVNHLQTIQNIFTQFPNINVEALKRYLIARAGFTEQELGDLLSHVNPKNLGAPVAPRTTPETTEPKGMEELLRKQQQRQLVPAGASFKGRITVAVEEGAPAGLQALPEDQAQADPVAAPEGDLTVEEGDASAGMNVEATPSPAELTDMAQQGPQWEIDNMLSINKAEEYYNQLKKDLEAVAFNPNIKMDLNGISQYDKVRNMIDAELNKIKEAIKGKEKIEKKEYKLEEEVKGVGNPELTVEEGEPTQRATTEPEGIEEAEPSTEGA